MAKPEVFDSVGLGRPERRVTFEAKKSPVSEITKRGRTRRVRTLDKHCYNSFFWGRNRLLERRPVVDDKFGDDQDIVDEQK
jgi:hypothetical protein